VAKSAPAAKGKSGDVLKLVPAEAAGGQPDGKLSVLEQQVSAREQSLKDAEARIAALEQQLKSLQSGKPMASQAAAVVPAASAPRGCNGQYAGSCPGTCGSTCAQAGRCA
jgi:pilus assembly protein FimV